MIEQDSTLLAQLAARDENVQALTAQVSDLQMLVNSLDGILWTMDPDSGQILYLSTQVERILGYTPDQVKSTPRFIDSKIVPEDLEAVRQQYRQFSEEEDNFQIEYRMRNAADEIVYIRTIYSPGRDRNGAGTVVRGFSTDVTQYKHMAERNRSMEVELRQAHKLEAVGQLAAGIAHEINTPTQFISDNLNFLKDVMADVNDLVALYSELADTAAAHPDQQSSVEQISNFREEIDYENTIADTLSAIQQSLEGTERISSIVKSMKEFSHPGGTEKESVDINKAIQSTINVARNEWRYIAEMVADLSPNLPLLPCYPGEINQTILNLIVNAAHAIDEKTQQDGSTEKGTITVSSRMDMGNIVVAISDTGCGIPAENIDKIYNQFFTTKAAGKGTGQGLAMAYACITERHRGKLDVDSTVGVGTTFTLTFDIGPDMADDDGL